MTEKKHTYILLGKEYEYSTYEFGNNELDSFKKMFSEQSEKEEKYLKARGKNGKAKYSTQQWAGEKIKLFGFYKSRPDLFKGSVANNTEHPLQFYSIELK